MKRGLAPCDLGLEVGHRLGQCLYCALQFRELRLKLIVGEGGGRRCLGRDTQDELEGGVGVEG